MTERIKIEEKCKPRFEKHCELWGYKTELDEDGFYIDSLTQRIFNAYYDAWQASRAGIVVKLPDAEGWTDDGAYSFSVDLRDVQHALDDAGVSYE